MFNGSLKEVKTRYFVPMNSMVDFPIYYSEDLFIFFKYFVLGSYTIYFSVQKNNRLLQYYKYSTRTGTPPHINYYVITIGEDGEDAPQSCQPSTSTSTSTPTRNDLGLGLYRRLMGMAWDV